MYERECHVKLSLIPFNYHNENDTNIEISKRENKSFTLRSASDSIKLNALLVYVPWHGRVRCVRALNRTCYSTILTVFQAALLFDI